MRKRITAWCLSAVLAAGLAGCAGDADSPLDRNDPQMLTFCHSYTGAVQSALEDLIDDFNRSVGRKSGIAVRAIAVDAQERDDLLREILAGAEGAPAMPELVSVPRGLGAELLAAGRITALDGRFPESRLEEYVPAFVDAGRLPDGQLYLFPLAYTTEVLFVNRQLLGAFLSQSAGGEEGLGSFEGIGDSAQAYYQWTDEQTPAVPDDGSAFFTADSWLRLAAVGTAQLGDGLRPEQASLQSTAFQQVWQNTVVPGLMGAYTAAGSPVGLLKGEGVVCYTGPATDIGRYDNYQLASLAVLPYPVFAGGEQLAPLVGDGVAVASTTDEKEYAAAAFLAWLGEAKQNARLVAGSGFLPVSQKALQDVAAQPAKGVDDATVALLLETVAAMYGEYEWTLPLPAEDDCRMADTLEDSLQRVLRGGRQRALAGEGVPELSAALAEEFAAAGGDLRGAVMQAPAAQPLEEDGAGEPVPDAEEAGEQGGDADAPGSEAGEADEGADDEAER